MAGHDFTNQISGVKLWSVSTAGLCAQLNLCSIRWLNSYTSTEALLHFTLGLWCDFWICDSPSMREISPSCQGERDSRIVGNLCLAIHPRIRVAEICFISGHECATVPFILHLEDSENMFWQNDTATFCTMGLDTDIGVESRLQGHIQKSREVSQSTYQLKGCITWPETEWICQSRMSL